MDDHDRRCARCSAQVLHVTSSLSLCDRCAHKGYSPPLISITRNIASGEQKKSYVILPDVDGTVRVTRTDNSHPISTDYRNEVAERHVTDATPAAVISKSSNNCASTSNFSLNHEYSQHSDHCADLNENVKNQERSAVSTHVDICSRHYCSALIPSFVVIPDSSVTRRLWNQVGALQRDDNIDARCNLAEEYCDEIDLTACSNDSMNSKFRKLVKKTCTLEQKPLDVSVKEVEMQSSTTENAGSSYSSGSSVQCISELTGLFLSYLSVVCNCQIFKFIREHQQCKCQLIK